MTKVKIAILDDYQGVATSIADWSRVTDRAELTVFSAPLPDGLARIAALAGFQVICPLRERTTLDAALLEQLPDLRLIASTGARNAAIDGAAAERLGIAVTNTGGLSTGAVELTWGLILAAARHLPREFTNLANGGWQTTVGKDLAGARLGLVGLGKIGQAMARIGLAFGMDVVAWSPNLTDERAAAAGVNRLSRDDLFASSDFVSLHMVLSEQTRGLVGASDLGRMKRDAWVINTSRAGLIDRHALLAALQNRTIAGAAVDVFDHEPAPATDELLQHDNLVATPHLGFVTANTYRVFYQGAADAIADWLDQRDDDCVRSGHVS